MGAIVLSQSFTVQSCCNCGVAFAVPADFDQERRKDKRSFYCPNGHSMSYRRSVEDRLRAELAEKERLLQQSSLNEAEAAHALSRAERAKKRLEKRLASGVCPHSNCRRHFTNLQRHIETEHKGQPLPPLVETAPAQKLLQ